MIVQGAFNRLFDVAFWLILALVGWQYWQMQRRQRQMFGVCNHTLTRQILLAGLFGLIGGVIGSMILTLVGVTLNQLGLTYIWPVALALMVINMRFLCFAYAGGIVALANIVFGWPDVNVPQVLALVAVLHITESLLIAISGGYSAMPLIVKKTDGQLVGAFSLQNFWPLPLVILVAVVVPSDGVSGGMINMPEWWPLLPLTVLPEDSRWMYKFAPVVAALGYTDLAIASLPQERRRRSAWHLALYSLTLLALALLAVKYSWLQVIAAVLSPVGHELLIQRDSKREMEQPARFVPPRYGIMALDTVAGTPAARNLKPGDIIIKLAGIPVNNRYDLAAAISHAPEKFSLVIARGGRELIKNVRFKREERRLGVILVPEGDEQFYAEMTVERYGLFDWVKNKIRRK